MSVNAPERYKIDAAGDPFEAEFNAIVNLLRACDLDRVAAEAVAVLERAMELRQELPPEAYNMALGRAHSYLGEVASMRGERAAFVDEFTAAIKHLGRTKMLGALSRAHRGLAQAYLMLDMPALAIDHLERASVLVGGIDREVTRKRAQFECDVMTGLALVSIGRLNDADKYVRAAAKQRDDIFTLTGDAWLPGLADLALGSFHTMKGFSSRSQDRTEKGITMLRAAVRHFDTARLDYWRAFARERLADALRECDPAGGRALMREALELFTEIGSIHQAKRATKWLRTIDLPTPSFKAPTLRADETLVAVATGRPICVAGPATREVVEAALRASCFTTTVLIIGESGTGKESLARLIHDRGPRAKMPFIAVNCASISKELMDSDLFGHAKGAFTGASTTKIGKFEAADGGTLFLDEIGEIPVELQSKLLRALEESAVQRIGENEWRSVNVRVIVATNRNLEEEVDDGRFREDLFFRINGLQVHPRPLRERRDEIPYLSAHLARKMHRLEIDADAVEMLLGHDWPGNVRELRNVLDRAADGVMETGEATITREIIEKHLRGATSRYRRARAKRQKGSLYGNQEGSDTIDRIFAPLPGNVRPAPPVARTGRAVPPQPVEPAPLPVEEVDQAAEVVATAPAEARAPEAVARPGIDRAAEQAEAPEPVVEVESSEAATAAGAPQAPEPEPVVLEATAAPVAAEPVETPQLVASSGEAPAAELTVDPEPEVEHAPGQSEAPDASEVELQAVAINAPVDVPATDPVNRRARKRVGTESEQPAPLTEVAIEPDRKHVEEIGYLLSGTELAGEAFEVAKSALQRTALDAEAFVRGPIKSLSRLVHEYAGLPLESRAALFAEVETAFGVTVAVACIGISREASLTVPRGLSFLTENGDLRGTLPDAVRQMKRHFVLSALKEYDFNLTATARALGLGKPAASGKKGYEGLQTLKGMCARLDIELPNKSWLYVLQQKPAEPETPKAAEPEPEPEPATPKAAPRQASKRAVPNGSRTSRRVVAGGEP